MIIFRDDHYYDDGGGVVLQNMEKEFIRWMDWYGKSYGEFELHTGDFLDPKLSEVINSAT